MEMEENKPLIWAGPAIIGTLVAIGIVAIIIVIILYPDVVHSTEAEGETAPITESIEESELNESEADNNEAVDEGEADPSAIE